MKRTAIIIGAGPAGLTAAYELLKRTDIVPNILEKSSDIGGISKTVNYKGNRIDIGGHRFFSKSERVMNWWLDLMPIQETPEDEIRITYQGKSRAIKINGSQKRMAGDPANAVMLIRKRISRIYFLKKFFTYPLQLSFDTLKKLGLLRTCGILFSYIEAQLFPRKPERNLEDFFINRFGSKLYYLFFKDYTEKVWGIACSKISAEWGAQRIKGINIGKAIAHAVRQSYPRKIGQKADIRQKGTETSLIEHFLYPKFGPGQLWELVAQKIKEMGGKIYMQQEVNEMTAVGDQIISIKATDKANGECKYWKGDFFFSTMPVKELVEGLNTDIPAEVKTIAGGLQYRDFITVGILLRELTQWDPSTGTRKPLSLADTWIYIQEKDVKVGRLQLFHNWSPFLVDNPKNAWIGMEYFCDKDDQFWRQRDEDIKKQAIQELEKIGFATPDDILDVTVLRMEKTYPAYFGTYNRFNIVRQYLDGFPNLFLIGRNGMHKYNNSDHSVLTAMVAVDNICNGVTEKSNLWAINTEQEYHEERAASTTMVK